MSEVLDRAALYYPRIHIRDELWLKQTLLCFPQVRRMVPVDYPLDDPPGVREFRDLKGPRNEPLLYEEDVFGEHVYQAQSRLAERLIRVPEATLQRFSRDATRRQFKRPDSFQIFRGKLMDVLYFLEPMGLAWCPSDRHRGDWVAFHPDLGAAIMAFIAIGIAEAKGLDIVTDSSTAHFAVATRDEDLVFDELMLGTRPGRFRTKRDISDKVDDLVQVVIRSGFDLSRLSAQQIAELANDGKDLRAFKNALAPIADSLPDITDESERRKRFAAAAAEVFDLWRNYRKSLPRFVIEAIQDVSNLKGPDWVVPFGGAVGGKLVFGVEGLLLGLFSYAGIAVYRQWKQKASSPMRYLTRIQKAGATLMMAR